MDNLWTTNRVRNLLVSLGAVKPSRKAVEIVATMTEELRTESGVTRVWDVKYPESRIEQAIAACKDEGRREGDSHMAFAKALQVA